MTEFKSVDNSIDSAGAAKQVLSNLFYGWGYNFYRKENQLRADDLLVRSKVCESLASVRAHLAEMERAYRREHLPPPTREHPYPEAAAVATAQQLVRAQQLVEAIELRVRTAGAPEMDRINQRHMNERDMLEQLVQVDADLVQAAKRFSDAVLAHGDPSALAIQVAVLITQSTLEIGLARRQQVLSALAA